MNIKINNSLDYYKEEPRKKDEVVSDIISVLNCEDDEDFEINEIYHESTLIQGKDISCGYYVLLFLGARLNDMEAEKLENIEY